METSTAYHLTESDGWIGGWGWMEVRERSEWDRWEGIEKKRCEENGRKKMEISEKKKRK